MGRNGNEVLFLSIPAFQNSFSWTHIFLHCCPSTFSNPDPLVFCTWKPKSSPHKPENEELVCYPSNTPQVFYCLHLKQPRSSTVQWWSHQWFRTQEVSMLFIGTVVSYYLVLYTKDSVLSIRIVLIAPQSRVVLGSLCCWILLKYLGSISIIHTSYHAQLREQCFSHRSFPCSYFLSFWIVSISSSKKALISVHLHKANIWPLSC